jgi:hypothetical protein
VSVMTYWAEGLFHGKYSCLRKLTGIYCDEESGYAINEYIFGVIRYLMMGWTKKLISTQGCKTFGMIDKFYIIYFYTRLNKNAIPSKPEIPLQLTSQ